MQTQQYCHSVGTTVISGLNISYVILNSFRFVCSVIVNSYVRVRKFISCKGNFMLSPLELSMKLLHGHEKITTRGNLPFWPSFSLLSWPATGLLSPADLSLPRPLPIASAVQLGLALLPPKPVARASTSHLLSLLQKKVGDAVGQSPCPVLWQTHGCLFSIPSFESSTPPSCPWGFSPPRSFLYTVEHQWQTNIPLHSTPHSSTS